MPKRKKGNSRFPVTSSDEVRHLVGAVADDTVLAILKCQASVEDLEVAASYVQGEGSTSDRAGHPYDWQGRTALRHLELPMRSTPMRMRNESRSQIWVVAFLYDWATSIVAIFDIAGLDKRPFDLSGGLLHTIDDNWVGLMRLVAGIVAGLVVCGATLVVSFMAYNERREDMAGS